ncbi:MAG TPA: methionine biosynthesis protein MetW, partial [Actinomycetota bacterium]|nr:methionine biosynthesis protein MetW [Actinomycetota bacterium]
LDAVLDRLAYYERSPADAAMLGAIVRRLEELEEAEARRQFRPWFAAERLAEELRGSREEVLEAYRDLAGSFAGCAPVVDLGCGRGELLELLAGMEVEASGVEADAELVKAASEHGLAVEHGDALRWLGAATPESLGGIALLRVVDALSAQELIEVVGLAAEKLRPGGRAVVLGSNPGSPAGQARTLGRDPAWVRPVHPAYLAFLFREAGFAEIAVDRRPPPTGGSEGPAGVPAEGPAGGEAAEYVMTATR